MTNFTTRMMIAAATLVVAAGSASAQILKAEIPFTFRAAGVVMQPGTYQVKINIQQSGVPFFQIRSAEAGRSILLVGTAPHDPNKAWEAAGKAVLNFECGTAPCALTELWTGPDRPAYAFPRPKLGRDEPTRAAVVVMQHDKGE
ncbi:MAG: hypothetical protein LAQ69_02235 [Acidobacteriia bacterium]|nr:hypothetical protein [Terriglobia bacterium]